VAEPFNLTDIARLRTALPHVLADPTQTGERGIWTRASDVIPGLRINDGDPVVAAWGEQIWHAYAHWDSSDPDTLWLEPIPGGTAPLAVATDGVVQQLRDALTSLSTTDVASAEATAEAIAAVLDHALGPLFQEVNGAFEVVLKALEQRRQDVAWVLDAMIRDGSSCLDIDSPGFMVLARLAHRARPLMGDGGLRD
jgi:hypothetical protein